MQLQMGISVLNWEVLFGNVNEFPCMLVHTTTYYVCVQGCDFPLRLIGLKGIDVRIEDAVRTTTFHAVGSEYIDARAGCASLSSLGLE